MLKTFNTKLAKPRKGKLKFDNDGKVKVNSKAELDGRAKLNNKDEFGNGKVDGNKVRNNKVTKEKNY